MPPTHPVDGVPAKPSQGGSMKDEDPQPCPGWSHICKHGGTWRYLYVSPCIYCGRQRKSQEDQDETHQEEEPHDLPEVS